MKTTTLHVYVMFAEMRGIYDTMNVKIGVSDNPKKRLKGVQTGCPGEIHLIRTFEAGQDAYFHEGYFHKLYALDTVLPDLKRPTKAQLEAALQGHIRLADFTFDTGLRQVRWQGETLSLMPREYDLLLALVRHAGEIVSRDDLLHAIWQTPFDPGTNSVEVHVCKLRRRLAGMADRIWIETVRHRGYRLVRASASGG